VPRVPPVSRRFPFVTFITDERFDYKLRRQSPFAGLSRIATPPQRTSGINSGFTL